MSEAQAHMKELEAERNRVIREIVDAEASLDSYRSVTNAEISALKQQILTDRSEIQRLVEILSDAKEAHDQGDSVAMAHIMMDAREALNANNGGV